MNKNLYKQDKNGVVRFWRAFTEKHIVWTESGIVGKEDTSTVTTCYHAEPTNVGKKNERDAIAQAAFEVGALYKGKLTKNGYHDSIEATDTISEDVMLAHDASDDKVMRKVTWGFADLQVKLNGVRCRIKILDKATGQYIAYSRKNKVYKLPQTLDEHIKEVILLCDPHVTQLDGELYIHGMEFEEIVSMVKNEKHPERDALQFHWYDVVTAEEIPWHKRKNLIHIRSVSSEYRVKPVFTVPNIRDLAALKHWHDKFVKSGYEGVIIRNHNGLYECGKRSYHLLKYKEFMDAEFKIVGIVKDKRGNGVFVCSHNEEKFNVRWKAPDEKRKHTVDHPSSYIGRMLTVKFQAWSKYGIPIFPVGVTVRDYE